MDSFERTFHSHLAQSLVILKVNKVKLKAKSLRSRIYLILFNMFLLTCILFYLIINDYEQFTNLRLARCILECQYNVRLTSKAKDTRRFYMFLLNSLVFFYCTGIALI